MPHRGLHPRCWDAMQGLGRTCMYCGDGINDFAALATADVGMAIGSSDASAVAPISDKHTSPAGQPTPCTPPPHPRHAPCAPPAQPLLTPCTPPAHPQHTPGMPPAHPLHNPCSPPAHPQHTPGMPPAHPLHNPCSRPAHSLHTSSLLCAQNKAFSLNRANIPL